MAYVLKISLAEQYSDKEIAEFASIVLTIPPPDKRRGNWGDLLLEKIEGMIDRQEKKNGTK